MSKTLHEQQMMMFTKSNAPKCVLKYVKKGNHLPSEAQVKMFDLDDFTKIVEEYIKSHFLCYKAEERMIERAGDGLFKKYIQRYSLSTEAQIKMIELRKCNFIETYIQYYPLCSKAAEKWENFKKMDKK